MGIITAEALYPAAYRTDQNTISDLGGTRPPDSVVVQPSAAIFDTTMVVTGLAIIAAAYLLYRALRRRALAISTGLLGLGVVVAARSRIRREAGAEVVHRQLRLLSRRSAPSSARASTAVIPGHRPIHTTTTGHIGATSIAYLPPRPSPPPRTTNRMEPSHHAGGSSASTGRRAVRQGIRGRPALPRPPCRVRALVAEEGVAMRNTLERTVVVRVDADGGSSTAAVDFAATEAELRGLSLLLLSAHPSSGEGRPRTTLTAILRRVCTTWPGLAVTARNATGEAAAALIDASRTATALVVGRHAPDGAPVPGQIGAAVSAASLASPRLASRSDLPAPDRSDALVVAHSLCPTLIVPANVPALTQGPVLLGLGMSPEDEPATAFAFEEAALRRVPLLAVHVWSGIPDTAVGTISPFAYDLYEAQAAADRILAETLAGWGEKYPDVKVDRMPLYDVNPAPTLLDASALASLVVVGARRHARRSSQLLGTVTRTLTQHATRPVAVIRATHRT